MSYLTRNPPVPNKHDGSRWQDLSVLGGILFALWMGFMITVLLEDINKKKVEKKMSWTRPYKGPTMKGPLLHEVEQKLLYAPTENN